jgi:hypothetical protein
VGADNNKKKALSASKANVTSALTLGYQSGVGSEAVNSSESPRHPVSKRKVDELSSSSGPSEPDSCCLAPGNLFGDGPAAQGSTGKLAAESSRHLGATEGGLANAAVVAGRAGPQQPSRPHKPLPKGSDHSEPTASSDAVTRCTSLGDMTGPLYGMPDDTISNAQVATERRYRRRAE